MLANCLCGDIGWKNRDDHVRELHLRSNVSSEIGLSCLDGFLNLGQSPASLSHISLNFPCELDLICWQIISYFEQVYVSGDNHSDTVELVWYNQ